MTVVALEARVRRYDWGSVSAIPTLLGIEPDGEPVAELWLGAHPDDPSDVASLGRSLDAVIADDPVAWLGERSVEHFGARLPFLLKVLAAERALSIQVHPNLAQARAGYAAEDAAGVPRDAPQRNYRDPNHKPELVCALTPFEGLCGFRPVADVLATLAALGVAELDFLLPLLHGTDPLRTAFTALLGRPDPAALVGALLARLPGLGPDDPTARGVRLAAEHFPADVGTVLALLLQHVALAPGQAMFLDAGTAHCYLRGTAVEIMAASDNVLRCGLTPKHVDVPELLEIMTFAEGVDPRVPVRADGVYPVPVPDFQLCRLELGGTVELDDGGPRIVLCTSGAVDVGGVGLTPGHAAFVPAGEVGWVAGAGVVFVAGDGL